MRIDYHPAVAGELEEIRDHYEECSEGLGKKKISSHLQVICRSSAKEFVNPSPYSPLPLRSLLAIIHLLLRRHHGCGVFQGGDLVAEMGGALEFELG